MYAILFADKTSEKRIKGISRSSVSNLGFDDFMKVHFEGTELYVTTYRIGSNHLQLQTISQHKLALKAFDDKKFYTEDGKSYFWESKYIHQDFLRV